MEWQWVAETVEHWVVMSVGKRVALMANYLAEHLVHWKAEYLE